MPLEPLSICIVTPSKNQVKFIEPCIRSVLDPGHPTLDYVIMDGGSTDGACDIIEKYAEQLTYWQSKPDNGPYEAIADGFRKSDAEILGWINSDDMLTPWTLQIVGQLFADCPEVEWVTSGFQLYIGENGLPISHSLLPGVNKNGFYNAENLPGSGIGPATAFIQQESTFWRRALWEKAVCREQPLADLAGDFDLWARFFEHAHLYRIDIPLGLFRSHGDQRSVTDRDKYIKQALDILGRYGTPKPRPVDVLIARYLQWCKIDIPPLRPFYETQHIVQFNRKNNCYQTKEITIPGK